MSPKKEVPQLNYLAMCKLGAMVFYHIEFEDDVYYCDIMDYLAELPVDVVQHLLNLVLHDEDNSSHFNWLQTIMRNDVKRLDLLNFPKQYCESALELIGECATGLQQLNLGGMVVGPHVDKLVYAIKHLRNLKVLIIPCNGNDEVLEAVQTCTEISVLDVSGPNSFTAKALQKFKSEKLNVLNIGSRVIFLPDDDDGAAFRCSIIQMLKNLPNLKVLATYSFTGLALLEMYKEDPECRTKLKYIRDICTSVEILNAVVNLCPELDSITLVRPKQSVLPELSRLKHLNSLELVYPHCDELMKYLRMAGCKIQVLHLDRSKEGCVDVSRIADLCPDLYSLVLNNCDLACLNYKKCFPSLKSLKVKNCVISNAILCYFLEKSPLLERIVVDEDVDLTDGDIFSICSSQSALKALQELSFSRARNLTALAVNLLRKHCPNLTVIGLLSHWNIGDENLGHLTAIITSGNIDLKLIK